LLAAHRQLLRIRVRSLRPLVPLAAGLAVILALALILRRTEEIRGADADDSPILATAVGPSSATPAPALRTITAAFSRNETITNALLKHGLALEEIFSLVRAASPLYNLARIKAFQPYILNFAPDGGFHDFTYHIDDERYLTVYRHERLLVPVIKPFKYETNAERVSGVIHDSLFLSVRRAGEQDQLALDLAEIFQWDIDFHTDIQNDDSFRLLVEKKYLDGRFRKHGPILAAEITVQGRTYTAFRFENPDGKPAYYTVDGQALNKSFLKSPLKFTRISSRFSAGRRHPILKIVRPHLGVDYAAPKGTPVVAVAAGRVVFAGPRGDYGRLVQVRHARGYETMYAHLSGILVPPGVEVEQGQVIGHVGATGLASGPHLDFRVLQRGRFVNPRRVVVPPDPPVSQAMWPRFAALRDDLKARLDQMDTVVEADSR
jgi:murein DD-endopeptidase MepM/ murein hydrolase activator NlpD